MEIGRDVQKDEFEKVGEFVNRQVNWLPADVRVIEEIEKTIKEG